MNLNCISPYNSPNKPAGQDDPQAPSELRVIFVDDDRHVLGSLRRELRLLSEDHRHEFFDDPSLALKAIESGHDVLLVTDWMMAELDGLKFCMKCREIERLQPHRSFYIILLTGRQSTECLIEALDGGADDYLTKPFDTRELLARVRVGQRMLDAQRRLREANQRLARIATTDALIGACNRRRGEEILANELDRVRRGKESLSVVLMDLDRYKAVNDIHGHAAGDAVLIEFAARLQRSVRGYDSVVRWGGDEFVVIAPQANPDEVLMLAERLRNLIAETPFTINGNVQLKLTSSIGCATALPGAGATHGDLLAAADEAIYRVKARGGNMVLPGETAYENPIK